MDMGLGELGKEDVVFKRKFRWTFRVEGTCNGSGVVPEKFVKTGQRPNLQIEQTEINFLNAKMWISGKATWQDLQIVYYDTNATDMQYLWHWIIAVYDITNESSKMNSRRGSYTGTGVLNLYDGCGTVMETWQLIGVWPTQIDFGELDMASSEECNITLTMKYQSVKYRSYCPGFEPACDCRTCA